MQSRVNWLGSQKWHQQIYAEIHPDSANSGHFKVLGYQWRTLRFNDDIPQSTVKIMSVCREQDPSSLFFMQQARCLAVPCKFLHLFFFPIKNYLLYALILYLIQVPAFDSLFFISKGWRLFDLWFEALLILSFLC